jgi:transposase-like protein
MAKSPICLDKLFTGRQFEREVIVLCVRWYLRFKPSFLDLIEMMAERGLSLAHTTIMRWVQNFAPEFVHRWNRFVRQQAIPGALMRPISRSVASGRFFTAPWTERARLWISD